MKREYPLPFLKMQAVGNDFVVVDVGDLTAGDNYPDLAIALCDRRFGIGGDGLLIMAPPDDDDADYAMIMYNPDGTEDMCGNGLRCVVRQLFDTGLIDAQSRIETLSGIRAASLVGEHITCEMGKPRFDSEHIPTNAPSSRNIEIVTDRGVYTVDSVDTGTTHSIVWCETLPNDDEFFTVSPQIENAKLFPERTSLMWTQIDGEHTLHLRIWERGVGETLGCGTGACAAAVLARATGRLNVDGIKVVSKGGVLAVRWEGTESSPIYLTGNARRVYEGVWDGNG